MLFSLTAYADRPLDYSYFHKPVKQIARSPFHLDITISDCKEENESHNHPRYRVNGSQNALLSHMLYLSGLFLGIFNTSMYNKLP
jgi:hypothetical protein